jgi:hypothetical protein
VPEQVQYLRIVGRSISADERALIERVRASGFSGCNFFIDEWMNNPRDSRTLPELLAQESPVLFQFIARIKLLERDLEKIAHLDPDGVLNEWLNATLVRLVTVR